MVYSIFIIIIIGTKKNPHVIVHSRHRHQFSLNARAGIIDKFLIGPFSLDGKTNRHKVRWFFQHAFTRNIRGSSQSILDFVRGLRTMELRRVLAELAEQFLNRHFANKWIDRGDPCCMACSFSGFESIGFSFLGTLEIYRIRNIDWTCWNTTK